jgi:tetratricopeptide (TPR) repeat protein/DNA-binding CsgD family transcriptional regulator
MSNVIEQLELELDSATDAAEQVRLLNLISEEYQFTDPQQALAIAQRAVTVAVREKHRPGVAESYRNTGLGHFYIGNFKSALVFLNRSLRIFQELGDVRGEIRCLGSIASSYQELSDKRRTYETLQVARDLAEQCNTPSYTLLVLAKLGEFYAQIGDYPRSLDLFYQCLKAKEEADPNNPGLAVEILNIGTIHQSMRNYEKAIQCYERALQIRRESGGLRGQVIALYNLGSVYAETCDYEAGFACDSEAATIAETLGNSLFHGMTISRVGQHHVRQNNYELAEECFQKSITIGREANHPWVVMTSQIELAKLRILTERYDEAVELLNQALLLADEGGEEESKIEVHKLLTDLYEKLGDGMHAFQHHKLYVAVKEELLSQEKQNAVAEVQLRMEIETADKEREILRLKNERLELEMDHKAKDLTSLAMQLVQKNEFLDEVATRIKSLRDSDEMKRGLDPLLREIDGNRNAQGEWDQFEQQFRSIHYDFTDRLARDYPTLSPTELKVCSLLKINLATKEIANILCCSPRTVEDHRYSIRTKLGIKSAKNLSSYLAGL